MAKYMFKPLGNGKYGRILFVESIYQANVANGWRLDDPNEVPAKATITPKKDDEKK